MARISETLTAARLVGRLRKNVKRLTFEEWAERLHTAPESEKGEWNGLSPGGAAGALKVSRQRVHQLLTQGKLDGLEMFDERGNWGGFLVTNASIERYLASDRKPGPKPK